MLSQNVTATVPLVEIMLSGTANNQNCENRCVISQTVTVQKGTAIEWINNDLVLHILVSGKPEDKDNGMLFDSGQIWTGKFFIHNFNDVGVYHYFERDHPENTGIINVTDVTYPKSISKVTSLQTHDNNDSNLTIHNDTGVDVTGKILPPPALYSPEPPLKQFKSGIAANDIECKQGLQLVIKAEDGSPACVKPDTANVLIKRGWVTNTTQPNHMTSTNANDPFGITALVIYHPQLACLSPPSNTTIPSCPPNNFYLKINSNSTAYLLGYNICDEESCTKSNDLSVLLPINVLLKPDYQMIGLPVSLQWKYGDTVHIQLKVSPNDENKTASLIDLGNSTIVP